ncbi:NLR family CARD domain-containing protein 3 [Sarotherodon galilaeus]
MALGITHLSKEPDGKALPSNPPPVVFYLILSKVSPIKPTKAHQGRPLETWLVGPQLVLQGVASWRSREKARVLTK